LYNFAEILYIIPSNHFLFKLIKQVQESITKCNVRDGQFRLNIRGGVVKLFNYSCMALFFTALFAYGVQRPAETS